MPQKNSSAVKTAAVLGAVVVAVVLYAFHLYSSDDQPEAKPEAQAVEAVGTPSQQPPEVSANVWVSTPALIDQGREAFQRSCAVCHGKEGKGDGPAAKGLVPPPRNLVDGKWKQGGTTRELFVTLQKGVAGSSMPGFPQIPTVERWALVHFIRSITQDRPADNSGELEKFALETSGNE